MASLYRKYLKDMVTPCNYGVEFSFLDIIFRTFYAVKDSGVAEQPEFIGYPGGGLPNESNYLKLLLVPLGLLDHCLGSRRFCGSPGDPMVNSPPSDWGPERVTWRRLMRPRRPSLMRTCNLGSFNSDGDFPARAAIDIACKQLERETGEVVDPERVRDL